MNNENEKYVINSKGNKTGDSDSGYSCAVGRKVKNNSALFLSTINFYQKNYKKFIRVSFTKFLRV